MRAAITIAVDHLCLDILTVLHVGNFRGTQVVSLRCLGEGAVYIHLYIIYMQAAGKKNVCGAL